MRQAGLDFGPTPGGGVRVRVDCTGEDCHVEDKDEAELLLEEDTEEGEVGGLSEDGSVSESELRGTGRRGMCWGTEVGLGLGWVGCRRRRRGLG